MIAKEPGMDTEPSIISDIIAEKIHFSIKNSVIGIVKAIDEETIQDYCNFIERNYPVDVADWPVVKDDIMATSKKGPKIFLTCSSIKTKYKKKENIKIVACIQTSKDAETEEST